MTHTFKCIFYLNSVSKNMSVVPKKVQLSFYTFKKSNKGSLLNCPSTYSTVKQNSLHLTLILL